MIRTLLLAACCVSFAAAAAAADHAVEADPKPSKDGTLVMRMHGGYQLRPPSHLLGDGDASLYEASMALKRALMAPEPRLVLDCSNGFRPGLAAAEELAAVIRDNKHGKKVSILLDEADDQALVVAAACDEVVMPEAGLLEVDGISLSSYYFADALAKIGVKFHAVASGAHKTAHEALTRGGPSEAAKEELNQLANELDGTLLALSARPTLTVDDLKAARAKAPQPSAVATAAKLVDVAAEPGEWLAKQPAPLRVMKDAKHDIPDLSSMTGLIEFWAQLMQGSREERQPKVVAVVELAGTIVDGRDGDPGVNIAPGDTCELLDKLRDDARVVAVVLRIESPGGSASASDRIHHAVRRLDDKKPVVALFDSVAASGGYYVGCAAREILVHRATITGSIGVFGIAPDASGALEALGIHRYTVATGPRADLLGLGPWTDEKEAALKQVIADVDARFQGLVASRRKLDPAKVADLAGGRVYTGEQAITLGLADGLGTLASAVARARQLAGESAPLPLERYPRDSGLLGRLGLAQSSVGPVPASLRLWLEAARAHAPTVLAWANLAP